MFELIFVYQSCGVLIVKLVVNVFGHHIEWTEVDTEEISSVETVPDY